MALPLTSTKPLPNEIVIQLNDAYTLHLLATHPEKVLPPGKSLLSALSRPRSTPNPEGSIRSAVERAVKKAFWDEALESLSSPISEVQIRRLKALYADLHTAAAPLLPEPATIQQILLSPPSPTSSPLVSATRHMHELLLALRERCAPVRDQELNEILGQLDSATLALDTPGLAQIFVRAAERVLPLCEVMQDDLLEVVTGSLGEREIRQHVRHLAAVQERAVISKLWGPQEEVARLWDIWTLSGSWISRLVRSLESDVAVSVHIGPKVEDSARNPDHLPPSLLFSSRSVLRLQNVVQAVVITACLRALVPASSSTDLVERVLQLLMLSIDQDKPPDSHTRIEHLTEEVVRAARSNGSQGDRSLLTAAVERTIKAEDPVFKLLRKRLVDALESHCIAHALPATTNSLPAIPNVLRTGRGVQTVPGLNLGDEVPSPPVAVIKGFEGGPLQIKIDKIFTELTVIIRWTAIVWNDVINVKDCDTTSIPPLNLELDFQIRCPVEDPITVGQTPSGLRRWIAFAPGGTWKASWGSGKIVAGGQDNQVLTKDGSARLETNYILETNDPVPSYINIRTRGWRTGPPEVLKRLADPAKADSVNPSEYTFFLYIDMETGSSKYDFVNTAMWVARGARKRNEVFYDAYRLVG